MSDKLETIQTESGAARRGKRVALKNHCRRFWWLHLIIFLCVAALIICLVIFVGVQNIAQSKINDADLQIQGINILSPEPTKFLMQVNSTISTDGTVKADIAPFLGNLTLLDVPNAKPFAQLQFPATTADKFQLVNVSQEVTITDADAFAQFTQAFFQNEMLRASIQGKTHIQPAGLSRDYDVDFYKEVQFKGLNKLSGISLTDMKIKIGRGGNIPNFNATAIIPNPSYYTLELGTVTFDNFADGKPLGNLTLNNFTLRPGNNAAPVSAILDQTVIIGAATKRPYCETKKIPISLHATSVTKDSQPIPWLLDTLSSANQTVDISLEDTFRAVGLNFPGCS